MKMKHNYTSELELKSLLIRIKNMRLELGSEHLNDRIAKYIKWHTIINKKTYIDPQKRNVTKAKLKLMIIDLSERTCADKVSYERFGEIVLLMTKNLLRKPTLSGYTYQDDFYSTANHNIFTYLTNFDHLIVSKRSGTMVNAFAYISQIIFNSIRLVLNTKKKERETLKTLISDEQTTNNANPSAFEWTSSDYSSLPPSKTVITKFFDADSDEELFKILQDNKNVDFFKITTEKELYIPTKYKDKVILT